MSEGSGVFWRDKDNQAEENGIGVLWYKPHLFFNHDVAHMHQMDTAFLKMMKAVGACRWCCLEGTRRVGLLNLICKNLDDHKMAAGNREKSICSSILWSSRYFLTWYNRPTKCAEHLKSLLLLSFFKCQEGPVALVDTNIHCTSPRTNHSEVYLWRVTSCFTASETAESKRSFKKKDCLVKKDMGKSWHFQVFLSLTAQPYSCLF